MVFVLRTSEWLLPYVRMPALPEIGASLGAEVGAVQWSLTAFFVALGVGQLFYGPVSDMVGRKPPLYAGLALFTLGS